MLDCAICGWTGLELVSHLRCVHELSTEAYQARHGGALVSYRFGRFLKDHEVVFDAWGCAKERVSFFGVSLDVNILPPNDFVPRYDPGFLFPEQDTKEILLGIKAKERLLLVGPTGCGKSTLVEQIASQLRWPVVRISMSRGVTEDDLLGIMQARNGSTSFAYGFLPRAMRMGAICLVDEIDGMEPSVGFAIHQPLESEGKLVILANEAEVIQPDPYFRFIATANTLGTGDDAGLYTGARVLNAAFLDRFDAIHRITYPAAERELEIVCSRVPGCDRHAIVQFIQIANDVRAAVTNNELYVTFSTRRLIDLARKLAQLDGDVSRAFFLSVLNKIEGPEKQTIWETAQRYLGEALHEIE